MVLGVAVNNMILPEDYQEEMQRRTRELRDTRVKEFDNIFKWLLFILFLGSC